jgi:SAM-dependent methyltransferase
VNTYPNLVLHDIEDEPLPFRHDEFDAILFVETIEHLPHSPIYPLREMLRVAKPGAPLVVTTPNLVRGSNRLRFLMGHSPLFPVDSYFEHEGRGSPLEHRHNREYTHFELDGIIRAAGWTVEDSGLFVAYSRWLGEHLEWSYPRRLIEHLKYAAQQAVPSMRDSLYVVGRKALSAPSTG